MATLAGSVTVNPTTGVATGSGMALALYNVMVASSSYSSVAVNTTIGMTLSKVIQARIQLADLCNSFAIISDGPRWIPTAIKTGNYNAAPWELVLVDPTAAGFFVSLPSAVTTGAGVSIAVKNASASTNSVTVNSFGGLIDNITTFTMTTGGACYHFTSNGSNWYITARF